MTPIYHIATILSIIKHNYNMNENHVLQCTMMPFNTAVVVGTGDMFQCCSLVDRSRGMQTGWCRI